jgi:hypothetical protein
MARVLVSLLLFSLLACSVERTDDLSDAQLEMTFALLDARLRGMTGASERQLLGAMGRMPDTSFPARDDQTRVLQWWWDTPSCSPRRVVDAYSLSPIRESFCTVEWTVSQGISQTYRWEGFGCRSIPLANWSADPGSHATFASPSRLNGLDAF